jgi:hypothetical protein
MSVETAECVDESVNMKAPEGPSPERIRSFCLVPPSSGVRSFRLAGNPFMSRRPTFPSRASDPGEVRSFRLAPASSGARSFRLTLGLSALSFAQGSAEATRAGRPAGSPSPDHES